MTLSFFFKEVIDVDVSLPYKLFEQFVIVDAPLFLTTTTDAIVDPSFELSRARIDATEAMMTALKSKDFTEYLLFRENNNDKEVSMLSLTSVV